MKESEFVFDSVDLLYYKLYKISLNWGRSYIDFSKWLKNQKTTRSPKNDDEKCSYFKLSLLLINIIAKKYVFYQIKKIGKGLNQIITQLLLILHMYLTIAKK